MADCDDSDDFELSNNVEPASITFSVFSSEEIRKLSVLEIRTPLIFDSVGQPLPSGLYDTVLGPLEKFGEPCGTCKSTSLTCPGHWSHISLPLPVINPLFYKNVTRIIKLACNHCYRVQIPVVKKQLLLFQLRLLDDGFPAEAQDAVNCLPLTINENSNSAATELLVRDALIAYRQSVRQSDTPRFSLERSKVIQTLKIEFIDEMYKKLKSQKCLFCSQTICKFSGTYKTLYMTVSNKKVKDKSFGINTKNSLMPSQMKEILRKMWEHESELILALVPTLRNSHLKTPTDHLFLDTLAVVPPKCRPLQKLNNKLMIHPQTNNYKPIIQDCFLLRHLIQHAKNADSDMDEEVKQMVSSVRGNTPSEKLHHVWQELQVHVDHLMDTEFKDSTVQSKVSVCLGLKQLMDKKQGFIRQNMMGKRVNYAARSVITPDPNLDIDEIGVPEQFAMVLTYPTPVTSLNVVQMRKMIINGPNVHPGAVMVENEDGGINKISSDSLVQRETLAKRLLTPSNKAGHGVKVVHRHIVNGDVLLLNRQPTLHRPGIMAHKARILKGEKTFRLNYANCKAYNADFDGDEMNAHCPQNELARSEAYNLVSVCNNYLVPKDGTPLSGLIQDHVIAGVKLTVRGRFFNKHDYNQLVFQALSSHTGYIKTLPPSIIKPVQLWSGKQIISTIVINIIPIGSFPINMDSSSKISVKAWQNGEPRAWLAGGSPFTDPQDMSECAVIIREGELLSGVLDKQHYGATPFGLVHCLFELYGGVCSSKFLSALSKLFTIFLQLEGFTLGVEDILVVPAADQCRGQAIEEARRVGNAATASAFDLDDTCTPEQLREKQTQALGVNRDKWRPVIDRAYKKSLDEFTNVINKVCLPAGLLRKFPHNNLQLMVQSGAKGSTVNTMQISCLLGQIELEGKRPPLMISGKSLPTFPKMETSPRAGGFIDGRFLTGIRPPEFFFHCMAGREGLIDTAVKTSRSGYLQRCLVKHLEGVIVQYDQTVRDSDGAVIQYYYGEDGLDVVKAPFLTPSQFPFLINNAKAIVHKSMLLENKTTWKKINSQTNRISRWLRRNDVPHNMCKKRMSPFASFSEANREAVWEEADDRVDKMTGRCAASKKLQELWRGADDDVRASFMKTGSRCPDPVTSMFRVDRDFGAISESIEMLMVNYLSKQPESSNDTENSRYSQFREVLSHKSMRSVVPAGEPVGILAAQSIGEPSTQMTLNTFHFAGRGEMNVTLGIPRLREILMMASKFIKTPSMDIPFNKDVEDLEAKADALRKEVTKVTLSDVLENVSATYHMEVESKRLQVYRLKLHFLPHKKYSPLYCVTPDSILRFVEKKFVVYLLAALRKQENVTFPSVRVETKAKEKAAVAEGSEVADNAIVENCESSDEEGMFSDEDATTDQRRRNNDDYEDPEEGEQESDGESEADDVAADQDGTDAAEDEETTLSEATPVKEAKTKRMRRQNMINSSVHVVEYDYDDVAGTWCYIDIGFSLDIKRLDFSTLLKHVADMCVIWEVPCIKRSFTYTSAGKQQLMFKTDGINIPAMVKYRALLDLNKLYTNDVYGMSMIYGIEAGRRVIVKEVQDVFNMYGITVDPRHLLLIADYMTFTGTFKPLSRFGMEQHVSPMQQMSFEASIVFLKVASVAGMRDELESPSSRVMVGRPCRGGTGLFDIVQSFTRTLPAEDLRLGLVKTEDRYESKDMKNTFWSKG